MEAGGPGGSPTFHNFKSLMGERGPEVRSHEEWGLVSSQPPLETPSLPGPTRHLLPGKQSHSYGAERFQGGSEGASRGVAAKAGRPSSFGVKLNFLPHAAPGQTRAPRPAASPRGEPEATSCWSLDRGRAPVHRGCPSIRVQGGSRVGLRPARWLRDA